MKSLIEKNIGINYVLGAKYVEKEEHWVWPSDQMVFFKGIFGPEGQACNEELCHLATKYFLNNTYQHYDVAIGKGMHCLTMGKLGWWQANPCDNTDTFSASLQVVCEAKRTEGKNFYFEKMKYKDEL